MRLWCEIEEVISSLDLPADKGSGNFDKRAQLVWQYVAENVKYCPDEIAQGKQEFWQFPAETLALGKGDCEDCAFLLASLLLASGISPFCVRVVLGRLIQEHSLTSFHAWPIYKDEQAISRLDSGPSAYSGCKRLCLFKTKATIKPSQLYTASCSADWPILMPSSDFDAFSP